MARDLYRPFDDSDSQAGASSSSAPKDTTPKDTAPKDYYRPWVEPEPEPAADQPRVARPVSELWVYVEFQAPELNVCQTGTGPSQTL